MDTLQPLYFRIAAFPKLRVGTQHGERRLFGNFEITYWQRYFRATGEVAARLAYRGRYYKRQRGARPAHIHRNCRKSRYFEGTGWLPHTIRKYHRAGIG